MVGWVMVLVWDYKDGLECLVVLINVLLGR